MNASSTAAPTVGQLIRLDGVRTSLTALRPHPNDPGNTHGSRAHTFLTELDSTIPAGTDPETVADVFRREAARAAELAADGILLRLWSLPETAGVRHTLGLWSADDEADLYRVLALLPLYPWMTVTAHLIENDATAEESTR